MWPVGYRADRQAASRAGGCQRPEGGVIGERAPARAARLHRIPQPCPHLPSHDPRLRAHRARILLLFLCMVGLGSCGGQVVEGTVARSGDWAIGVALNPRRPGMQTIYNGVELAIEQLNRERRGKGSPFVMRRTPDNVASAIQIATILRNDPSVVGVVGHPESGSTLEAAPVYEDRENGGENAVVAISPTATSPALTGLSHWLFRVCPTDIAASAAAARFALDSLHSERAAIIYRNDAYGRDWTRAFVATYTSGGGKVVQRDPYLPEITEWDAFAAYTARLAPEVILFPGSAEDAELLIHALRRAGVDAPILGGDAIAPLATNPAEFAGVRYTAFFEPAAVTSNAGRAFVQGYRIKFGMLPDQRAALAYDAAMILGRAALAERGDRKRIRDHVAAIGAAGRRVYDGATGRIAFDARHDVVGKPVVMTRIGAK